MPYKDPVRKKEWNEAWKKKGKEIGYNDWLYQRRKLRFDDAEQFREALERIAGGEFHPQSIAMTYLKESDRRATALGPSPRHDGVKTLVEHPNEMPPADTLLQAVAKLGLKT